MIRIGWDFKWHRWLIFSKHRFYLSPRNFLRRLFMDLAFENKQKEILKVNAKVYLTSLSIILSLLQLEMLCFYSHLWLYFTITVVSFFAHSLLIIVYLLVQMSKCTWRTVWRLKKKRKIKSMKNQSIKCFANAGGGGGNQHYRLYSYFGTFMREYLGIPI